MSKSRDAFRTISEVSAWLDTPAHVLRFWESKFSQIKPVKRAGGRRYYRPQDMELLGGIKKLLHEDGMTIKGVQKLLREKGVKHVSAMGASLNDPIVETIAPVAPPQEQPDVATATQEPSTELNVEITNIVRLPRSGEAPANDITEADEPAKIGLDLAAIAASIPADPSDASSRAQARFFDIYRHIADPDTQLAAQSEALAPILSRLETLRARIDSR